MEIFVYLIYFHIYQFRLVVQSCPTLCDPMNHNTPGPRVHDELPEFTQTHVHWVGDTIQPCHAHSSPSPPPAFIVPSITVFPMSQLFASDGQSIGASAWVSVLPMNIQSWFPLGLTGLISYCSRDSQVFSSTTIQMHQFFST